MAIERCPTRKTKRLQKSSSAKQDLPTPLPRKTRMTTLTLTWREAAMRGATTVRVAIRDANIVN